MRLCCHGIYPRRAGDLYPKQQVSAVCVGYEVYYVYARYKKNEKKKSKEHSPIAGPGAHVGQMP